MENIKLENYLKKEILEISNNTFKELKKNNIDIFLSQRELSPLQLEKYQKIYNNFQLSLIRVKKNAIKKYGLIENFNLFFGLIVNNAVIETRKKYYND